MDCASELAYLIYSVSAERFANRSSGPNDSLMPPVSPYPSQIEPSPVDSNASNGTETTDIEEEAQEIKSPGPAGDELQSPDVEIRSPQSANSVRRSLRYVTP